MMSAKSREQPEPTVAQRHKNQNTGKGDDGRDATGLNAVLTEFRTDCALLQNIDLRRQSPGPQKDCQTRAFINRKISGYDARSARYMALNDRRRNHLFIKDNRKRVPDVVSCIFSEHPPTRRVEPETDRRSAVLIKRRRGIHKILAGDHRTLFKDVERASPHQYWAI